MYEWHLLGFKELVRADVSAASVEFCAFESWYSSKHKSRLPERVDPVAGTIAPFFQWPNQTIVPASTTIIFADSRSNISPCALATALRTGFIC